VKEGVSKAFLNWDAPLLTVWLRWISSNWATSAFDMVIFVGGRGYIAMDSWVKKSANKVNLTSGMQKIHPESLSFELWELTPFFSSQFRESFVTAVWTLDFAMLEHPVETSWWICSYQIFTVTRIYSFSLFDIDHIIPQDYYGSFTCCLRPLS